MQNPAGTRSLVGDYRFGPWTSERVEASARQPTATSYLLDSSGSDIFNYYPTSVTLTNTQPSGTGCRAEFSKIGPSGFAKTYAYSTAGGH